jgi:RNA polymerase sigma-70 factor (ECF subfamily)
MARIETALTARLHARAGAERWALPVEVFATALERSASKCPAAADLAQYLEGLHLGDLALAAACEEGLDAAWEHFVREYRPALYRAAQAIDRSGDARELADSLYAELFGVRDRGEARPSLFRYFHGRSTLATWVRSVLAQRHIDRMRAGRRFDPLPEEDEPGTLAAPVVTDHAGERPCAQLVRAALAAAIAGLPQGIVCGWAGTMRSR